MVIYWPVSDRIDSYGRKCKYIGIGGPKFRYVTIDMIGNDMLYLNPGANTNSITNYLGFCVSYVHDIV